MIIVHAQLGTQEKIVLQFTTSEGGTESAVYHVCLPRFVVEGGRYLVYGSLYQVTTFPGKERR